jgi:aminopeptidase YwaD
VKLDNKELILGHDYLPLPTSKTLKGEFNIKYIAINKNSKNKKILKAISKDPTDFYFLDFTDAYLLKAKDIEEYNTLKSLYYSTKSIPLGYIVLDSSSFFYTAKSFFNINYPVIMLNTNTYDNSLKPQKVYIDYKVKTVSNAELCNIVGYIPGIKYPDSFIVIGAHYDHLGKIADKHFPGANDNASGTVMLLDLAKKLATEDEKPNYSIIFISFAGEEIGLLGSKYFTTNPPVDLKNIKLMINLDMVGTGKDGISVVNAKKNPSIYNKLKLINEEKNYVVDMIEGGASCSSDHCPFDQRGVPAIFIFSRDKDYRYYHVMEDDYEILPLDGYEGIFKLIYDLIMNY